MSEPHFATVWEAVADAAPHRTALVQGDMRRTWVQFDERAARLAGALRAAGLGEGARVALYLYNCPEYLEAFYAALKIRAIPCNINFRYLSEELRYLLNDFEADAIVFHASLGDRVEQALARTPRVRLAVEVPDGGATQVAAAVGYEALLRHDPAPRQRRSPDDFYVVYTGGTTGLPKGVIRPLGPTVERIVTRLAPLLGYGAHTTPYSFLRRALQEIADDRQLVSLPAAPLIHHTGFGLGATPALTAAGRVVLLPGRHFDADELWDTVEREQVRVAAIVGDAFARPMLAALEQRDRAPTSLRVLFSSGAMFSRHVKAALLEHLPDATIVDFIASTEAPVGRSIATAGSVPPTSRFEPFPGATVVADDGTPIPPGSPDPGHLAVPGAFAGYLGDPTKTRQAIRHIDGQPYTITGDMATVDADGTITLLGRGSTCINTGGEKVYPEEVEEAVKRLPGVRDCLIFGVPDERFGERVAGIVSLAPSARTAPDDLIALLRKELAAYKIPRQLIVADPPRTATGKPDYEAARRLYRRHLSASEPLAR